MRKQTKLVAVLSAAALLALGASMTSFAAGWEKDDAGVWHYMDEDDEMVTGEWKKDGGKWFYLDEDGDMLTNDWVDDDYYVGEDGAMLVNQWVKTYSDEDQDDPDADGEHWYYFGSKGKKVYGQDKKINGKTYLFNDEGKMLTGWQGDSETAYYYGGEDDGARTESQWLWLEKSGLIDDDDDLAAEGKPVLGCGEDDDCDDEGWYWFGSNGKATTQSAKKKINGKWYMFNEHGQMLYEWIDNDTKIKRGTHAQLDDTSRRPDPEASNAEIAKMFYYNDVEDGSRADGWYQLDGAKDVGTDSDTDWYYIDDGKVKHATDKDFATVDEELNDVCVMREKINGKYFAFNQYGQMQDGLQYIAANASFYYFDEDGYQKTGKVAAVECDDDDYSFYFNTSNGKNGQGYKGEKDGYLYFNGKRLEADDDYRLYYHSGDIYLVNTKGKIQKANTDSGKKFDIENKGIAQEDVVVKTDKNGKVAEITYIVNGTNKTLKKAELLATMNADINEDLAKVTEDTFVSVPFIALYDDLFTYTLKEVEDEETATITDTVAWVGVNADDEE